MMPFSSTNERSLIEKITNYKIPDFPIAYSKELKQVFESCMSRSKEERPTAKYLLGSDTLQQWARELQIMNSQLYAAA
jgi:hypothetical protein